MLFAAVLGGAAGVLTIRAGTSLLRASSTPSSRVAMSTVSTALEVEQFGCLSDNYGFLLHDATTGSTAAIDTPEVGPIVEACERRGWTLTHILNTHHHHDHAGGNAELKRRFGCTILGPAAERAKIPTIDTPVQGGDRFAFGAHQIDVLDVGGHTLGHVAYHAADAGVAFVGDSLFALGCGRLFEGTPAQAWASLQRLAALPPDTKVYCAHEYTEANLRFALTVDPDNPALQSRAVEIAELRAAGKPTCAAVTRAAVGTAVAEALLHEAPDPCATGFPLRLGSSWQQIHSSGRAARRCGSTSRCRRRSRTRPRLHGSGR